MNVFFVLWHSVFIPLILTIGIEFAIILPVNKAFFQYIYLPLSIVAVNLATNPALNILSVFADPGRTSIAMEIILELLVILAEAGILFAIYRKQFRRLFILSCILNICSYCAGLFLFPPPWI